MMLGGPRNAATRPVETETGEPDLLQGLGRSGYKDPGRRYAPGDGQRVDARIARRRREVVLGLLCLFEINTVSPWIP